jgi:gluconolactonase
MNILTDSIEFGEGPAFTSDNELWCVDLAKGCLIHYSESGMRRIPSMGTPNAVIFDSEDRGLVCDSDQNEVQRLCPEDDRWQTIVSEVDGESLRSPNDLVIGPDGSLLFTCPGGSRDTPVGYVCCVEPGGLTKKVGVDIQFPNGLAFSADGSELIVAETYRHRLWKGRWDENRRQWRDPEVWCDIGGPVGPDGMALGTDGRMYVAVYGTGEIRAVNQSGEVVEHIDVPGQNPTNVAFDPTGHFGMVVTEADKGLLISYPSRGAGAKPFTVDSDSWL